MTPINCASAKLLFYGVNFNRELRYENPTLDHMYPPRATMRENRHLAGTSSHWHPLARAFRLRLGRAIPLRFVPLPPSSGGTERHRRHDRQHCCAVGIKTGLRKPMRLADRDQLPRRNSSRWRSGCPASRTGKPPNRSASVLIPENPAACN